MNNNNKYPGHVMLIDDDEDDIRIFKVIVKQLDPNITVTTATHGTEAFNVLREEHFTAPDLIFLDINMPVMNGFEFLAEMKADSGLAHVPVIMYSTSSIGRDVGKAYDLGASLYVVKPFDIYDYEVLLKKIFALDWNLFNEKVTKEKFLLGGES